MQRLAWEAVRTEFAFDGGWRDVYVFGTDMTAWQQMIDWLRASGYDLSYFRDGQPATLPALATDAFPVEGECDRLLSVRFCGVLANCHFFTSEEIEFDIDPREVVGQTELDGLFGFMGCLAEAVGRDVILCPENCPQTVVFRARAGATAVEHQTFGGLHD
jgi:hypothetical protein